MDRYLQACAAAERIINTVECAGFNVFDPTSIINSWDYCSMPDGLWYSYGASRLVICYKFRWRLSGYYRCI